MFKQAHRSKTYKTKVKERLCLTHKLGLIDLLEKQCSYGNISAPKNVFVSSPKIFHYNRATSLFLHKKCLRWKSSSSSFSIWKEQRDLVSSAWANQTAPCLAVILKCQRSADRPWEVWNILYLQRLGRNTLKTLYYLTWSNCNLYSWEARFRNVI